MGLKDVDYHKQQKSWNMSFFSLLNSSITSTSHALLTFLPVRGRNNQWISLASASLGLHRAKPHYDDFRLRGNQTSSLGCGPATRPDGPRQHHGQLNQLLESRVGLAATERIEESKQF